MILRLLRLVLPVVVLGATIAAAASVVGRGPTLRQSVAPLPVTLAAPTGATRADATVPTVAAVVAQARSMVSTVSAHGVVEPARQVRLMAEVAGRVVHVADRLIPGGRVAAGDLLVRIDPRAHELQIEQFLYRLRAAELEIELMSAALRTDAAASDDSGDHRDNGDTGDAELSAASLARRRAEREIKRLETAALRSALRGAQLRRAQTVIEAPFDAAVVAARVDVGQVVDTHSELARLIGSKELWVRVAVPVSVLPDIDIPGFSVAADAAGGRAAVHLPLADGSTVARPGRVLRLIEELDPQSRLAQLLIALPGPAIGAGSVPLLTGSYVEVVIDGALHHDVVPLPRSALRAGDTLWVVEADRLVERRVQIGWTDSEQLFVTVGVGDGELVVVGPVADLRPGWRVDVERQPPSDALAGNFGR